MVVVVKTAACLPKPRDVMIAAANSVSATRTRFVALWRGVTTAWNSARNADFVSIAVTEYASWTLVKTARIAPQIAGIVAETACVKRTIKRIVPPAPRTVESAAVMVYASQTTGKVAKAAPKTAENAAEMENVTQYLKKIAVIAPKIVGSAVETTSAT